MRYHTVLSVINRIQDFNCQLRLLLLAQLTQWPPQFWERNHENTIQRKRVFCVLYLKIIAEKKKRALITRCLLLQRMKSYQLLLSSSGFINYARGAVPGKGHRRRRKSLRPESMSTQGHSLRLLPEEFSELILIRPISSSAFYKLALSQAFWR